MPGKPSFSEIDQKAKTRRVSRSATPQSSTGLSDNPLAMPQHYTSPHSVGRTLSPAHILNLQRTHGNHAVSGMLNDVRSTEGISDPIVQRHSSFEHRLLGDAKPSDLNAAAGNLTPENRQHVLEAERQRLLLWKKDPEKVTEAQVQATWPDTHVLTLKNGLVLTYGELNTLPDYMSDPTAIDNADKSTLLPILQLVRQQGFDRITDLVGAKTSSLFGLVKSPDYQHFDGAIGPEGSTGTIASIRELSALNDDTKNLGSNQYQSLVARNACHFAPYSWNRWQDFHTQARDLAQQGHDTGDKELIRKAWLTNGYADHFLQDSFAAGHLINKTLIMQWFVEWVKDYNSKTHWYERDIHLDNWDKVQHMTTAEQPKLAARGMYNGQARSGSASADPQTAEEQGTRQQREDMAGVQAGGGKSQDEEYKNYLAFLNNTVIQSAAGKLHDYFNERSLWVNSPSQPNAYQIWGDETLLKGGAGVQIAGETAHMSQQVIQDLSMSGATAISAQQIRDRFPNKVYDPASKTMLPLEQWNDSLRDLCWKTIFPDVHYRILSTISTTMGKVSKDA